MASISGRVAVSALVQTVPRAVGSNGRAVSGRFSFSGHQDGENEIQQGAEEGRDYDHERKREPDLGRLQVELPCEPRGNAEQDSPSSRSMKSH